MIRLVCDGCLGVTGDQAKFKTRGYVGPKQRHYCENCDEIVAEYLELIDELHGRLALSWEKESTTLRRNFFKANKGFELPDVDRGDFEDGNKN